MDISSPFDEGGRGWGWTKRPLGPPSPSSPPAAGRGDSLGLCLSYYGLLSKNIGRVKEVRGLIGFRTSWVIHKVIKLLSDLI